MSDAAVRALDLGERELKGVVEQSVAIQEQSSAVQAQTTSTQQQADLAARAQS
jgi:hypothetical protein